MKTNKAITCSYTGRHDAIEVKGATKEEARKAAMTFFRADCDDEGLTLTQGHLNTWDYDDPRPADWQDSYIFEVMDAVPVPREYYEY